MRVVENAHGGLLKERVGLKAITVHSKVLEAFSAFSTGVEPDHDFYGHFTLKMV